MGYMVPPMRVISCAVSWLLISLWASAAAVAGDIADPAAGARDQKKLAEPSLAAAAGGAADPGAGLRQVAAARKAELIALDGRLDEPAWHTAPTAGDFWQRWPHEGAAPGQATEFHVLYDDAAIYIGVLAHDDQPGEIRGMLTRRDEWSASDWIEVGIDSYHDRRTAFFFAVNPAGVQRDFLIFNDSEQDQSWNAVWSAAAHVSEHGWSAEFRIPLSQLRFSASEAMTWGMQVMRYIGRSNEQSVWSPWPRAGDRVVSRFGEVHRIEGITPPRRLELLPYAVGSVGVARIDDDNPFRGDAEPTGSLGLDFKYGLGQSATISGTINPDFGQVEADPSNVNLGASELFFAEKRPFFLEGTDIFKFSLGTGGNSTEQLFYTRRIGAAPHDTADGLGAYVSEPRATTIYGAAKLSGKTASGWSFGALDALTAEESATIADLDGTRSSRVIEPLTNYGVLRLAKDLRGGRTTISGALTTVHRRLEGTDLTWLHDQAYTGGLTLEHRFAGESWRLQTRLMGSYVHGSEEAIDETQRSPLRYYQRPDAGHLEYDPTRTSLAGSGLAWSLLQLSDKHWRYGAGGDVRSPGLELNDLGFQQFADGLVQWLWAQYRDDQPGRYLLSYNISSDNWIVGNWEPSLVAIGGNLGAAATFTNHWNLWGGMGVERQVFNNGALRGGPALRGDSFGFFWLGGSSDARKLVRADLSLDGRVVPASDSRRLAAQASVSVQALSNFNFSLGALVAKNLDDTQYVSDAEDTAGAPQYILGRIDQTTLALTVRMSYTFSSNLSLQLYAQPFTSTGGYTRLKSVIASRADAYADRFHVFAPDELSLADNVYSVDRDGDGMAEFSFDRPDFNFRELRSNLVMRWEYLPGSTVFVVWSHARASDDITGAFALGRELAGLADEPGEHLVMVKASYWYAL